MSDKFVSKTNISSLFSKYHQKIKSLLSKKLDKEALQPGKGITIDESNNKVIINSDDTIFIKDVYAITNDKPTSFTIPYLTNSTKDLILISNDNLTLIEGQDYTISTSTKTINLLKDFYAGEKIYYYIRGSKLLGDIAISNDNYYTKGEIDSIKHDLQLSMDNINEKFGTDKDEEKEDLGVPVFKAGKNDPYSQEPDKEGGEIQLAKPDNSNLTMNIAIDSFYNYIRFFTKVGDKTKIAIINFPKLATDTYNELCTSETFQVGNLEFFEPFALYSDRTYGAISRSGYNVHLNFLLANNGATTGNVCYLPVKARWCEIHACGGLEFRTLNDNETEGSTGLLVLNGTLPNDGSYTIIDITYTAERL